MKIGVHCSIRNGYTNALYEAKQLGCNCLQMFTHSPRMWKFNYPQQQEIDQFKHLRIKLGLSPLVIHTAYLPNPASSNEELYEKTKNLLLLEFELAELFSADYLVMHPGSYSEGSTLSDGITRVVNIIDYCFNKTLKKFKKLNFMLLLENVCGNGRKIGRTLSELAEIIQKSYFKQYIGICFDTAHGFAFGYNITTEEGNQQLIKELNFTTGVEKLHLIHLNDTKVNLNSKIDQHYHIAKGSIGKKGFFNFLKYFQHLPLILETPKETEFGQLSQKDKQNINTVKKLIKYI